MDKRPREDDDELSKPRKQRDLRDNVSVSGNMNSVSTKPRKSRFAQSSSNMAGQPQTAVSVTLSSSSSTTQASLSDQISFFKSMQDQTSSSKVGNYRPLVLDSKGREVDDRGEIMEASGPFRSLKANQAAQPVVNPYLQDEPASSQTEANFDDRLHSHNRQQRSQRSFKFITPGTFIKLGERIRDVESRKMIAGFSSGRNPNTKHTTDDVDVQISDSRSIGGVESTVDVLVPVLHIEWWDVPFLPPKTIITSNSHQLLSLVHCKTVALVEHPVPVVGLFAIDEIELLNRPIKAYLTSDETKRIRRQNRREQLKQKQDLILMGLLPPDEPRLKLTNLMQIMKQEATTNPSSVEIKMIEQSKHRELMHYMRNEARRKTPQEKREAKRLKLLAKQAIGHRYHVAVFTIQVPLGHVLSPQVRFKIDVNSQQLGLSGVMIEGLHLQQQEHYQHTDTNDGNIQYAILFVEGIENSIRKYVKLMMKRIDWVKSSRVPKEEEEEDKDGDTKDNVRMQEDEAVVVEGDMKEEEDDDDEDEEIDISSYSPSSCHLMWFGLLPKKHFNAFKFSSSLSSLKGKGLSFVSDYAHQYYNQLK